MGTRKSHLFLGFLALCVVLLVLMFAHAAWRQRADRADRALRAHIVAHHGLTDLCLFTDARYTRNPVMADFNTPFQDSPLSLDHFPSGSVLGVPPHLESRAAQRRASQRGGTHAAVATP